MARSRDSDLALLLLGLLCLFGTAPRRRRAGGQRPYGSVEQAWPEGVPQGQDNLGTVPLPGEQPPAIQPPAQQSPGWHPPMA
jgi:hypothetical protein